MNFSLRQKHFLSLFRPFMSIEVLLFCQTKPRNPKNVNKTQKVSNIPIGTNKQVLSMSHEGWGKAITSTSAESEGNL